MRYTNATFAVFCLAVLALPSCRGKISTSPPLHAVLDMDFQDKLKAQSASKFSGWGDHRGMRMPVGGTVARGSLGALDTDPDVARLHVYKDGDNYVKNPLAKSAGDLAAGRKAYDINCSICHGRTGRGNGTVGMKYPVKPPSFHKKPGKTIGMEDRIDERVTKLSDGELFEIITNGKGTMMPYAHQVPAKARWQIIHYIRALQLRVED